VSAPATATATSPAPPPAATATTTTPAQTTPAPTSTSTTPQEAPGEGNGNGTGGGGGGSEPARTELTFTGTSSGLSPKQAGVAPFIAIKVTLVSKDGSSHTLSIGGHTATVGGARKSASFTLPGLKAGRSYRGVSDGNTPIRILSTSEPGP
jgi:hypothetical protein